MAEEVEANQAPAAEPEPAVEPQVEVDSGEPVCISVETHVALSQVSRDCLFRLTFDASSVSSNLGLGGVNATRAK